jgi:hypothetical protein
MSVFEAGSLAAATLGSEAASLEEQPFECPEDEGGLGAGDGAEEAPVGPEAVDRPDAVSKLWCERIKAARSSKDAERIFEAMRGEGVSPNVLHDPAPPTSARSPPARRRV